MGQSVINPMGHDVFPCFHCFRDAWLNVSNVSRFLETCVNGDIAQARGKKTTF